MRAIVQERYGTPDDLVLTDIDKPNPGPGEVLVRVRAASVGPWVWRLIAPDPRMMRLAGVGLRAPRRKTPGEDMSGEVEAVGADVTTVRPGDAIYGEAGGTFAEYVCAAADTVAPKPDGLTFEQAAAVPIAANTALLALRDHGRVEPGQRVLIIGASGGVGTFAVQLAKAFGAEVTGVCRGDAVDLVRALGADDVIDYTRADVTDATADGRRFDVILQLGGTHTAGTLRHLLTREGRLVLSSGEGGSWVGPIGRIVRAAAISPFVSQQLRSFYARPNRDNLLTLTELIGAGKLSPVVDRTYPLEEAAAAIRSARDDHPRGKIALSV